MYYVVTHECVFSPLFYKKESGMSKNITDIYVNQLKKIGIPLLTANEERELAKTIEKGQKTQKEILERKANSSLTEVKETELLAIIGAGEKAWEKFVLANLRLVISIARQYTGKLPHLNFMDLVQEGSIGLLMAIKRFDWRIGCKFSGYANRWIRKFIREALSNQGRTIRIPAYLMEARKLYQGTLDKFWDEFGREPFLEEIIAKSGLKAKEIPNIKKSLIKMLALDDCENLIKEGIISLEEIRDNLSFVKTKLQQAFTVLTDQEQKVISMKYGESEYSQAEIEDQLGLSRAMISYFHRRAIKKLRNYEKIYELAEFV